MLRADTETVLDDFWFEEEYEGGCRFCGGFGAVYALVPGRQNLKRQVPCEHCQEEDDF